MHTIRQPALLLMSQTCMPIYTTLTQMTETFCLVTYILLTVKVNSWLIQCQLTLIRLIFMMCFNCKAMPTNNMDYSCHYRSCRSCLTDHLGSMSHHITPHYYQRQTHKHTHTHKLWTRLIFINQALWTVYTWFKNFCIQSGCDTHYIDVYLCMHV